MSLERRNLQNLIHSFDKSGQWPMDKYSKTLAQTILDSEWMKQHDQEIRANEKRRLLQDGYSQGEPRYCKKARERYTQLVAEITKMADDLWRLSQGDQTRIKEAGYMQDHVENLRSLISGDYLLK